MTTPLIEQATPTSLHRMRQLDLEKRLQEQDEICRVELSTGSSETGKTGNGTADGMNCKKKKKLKRE